MNTIKAFTSRLAFQPNWFQNFFRRYTFLSLLVLSILAGLMFGATVAYQAGMTQEAQQVAGLADYRPNLVTRVFAEDGKTVIGEFSLERRIPVTYEQIPEKLRKAILAIEDDRFYQHIGFDPVRLASVVLKNITSGRKAEGASTLTQQVARDYFLSPEKTYTRKIREILIALQIERYYTKEQILEMYCNQIFLGGGSYGFEAASQYYFSKSLKDLSLEECALLAGLPQAPSQYAPTRNEKAATERRNIVLYRMHEVGYITDDEYNRAKSSKIVLNVSPQQQNNNNMYGYFVEEVRQESEDSFGTDQTFTGGMNIYTTLDATAQREAVRAVRRGVHAYEDRHGKKWRGKLVNIFDNKLASDINSYSHADWIGDYIEGEYLFGLITYVGPATADVMFGEFKANVTEAHTKWAGGPPGKLFRKGDLAVFKVSKIDKAAKKLEVTLDQIPSVDGALLCLDSKTGDIKAMVGGYDFSMRKFNNATQAERQTGSCFKPFIYAAAVENGYTSDTVVSADPFTDKVTGWSPTNYDGGSGGGSVTLAGALQKSLNVVAVRLLSMVGVDKGAEVVKRFGLSNPMKRVLPSALGATEEPLIDMVSGYSVFSNQGVRVKPHLIKQVTDANGNVTLNWEAETFKVLSPYVASQMQEMMRGVVTGGTATAIGGSKELANRIICGKTGTVNDFTDAWFIGYTPTYTTGVWIGYPGLKKSLGQGEAGGVAALPMWIRFMEKFMVGKPNDKFPKASGPDKEILQKRAEAEKVLRRAQEEEAQNKSEDEGADDAKSAAQDEEPAKQPEREKRTPKMEESEPGDRPRKIEREERPKPREPVKQEVKEPEKKKRGKNG
jgi:penicillin-binding protein 1A